MHALRIASIFMHLVISYSSRVLLKIRYIPRSSSGSFKVQPGILGLYHLYLNPHPLTKLPQPPSALSCMLTVVGQWPLTSSGNTIAMVCFVA